MIESAVIKVKANAPATMSMLTAAVLIFLLLSGARLGMDPDGKRTTESVRILRALVASRFVLTPDRRTGSRMFSNVIFMIAPT